MNAIEIKDLKKRYVTGRKSFVDSLKGISFDIQKGEIFGYIGPNGAGKTTTLKILLGFIPKTSGELNIMGYDHREARFHVKIGYMPEDHSYYPHLKVNRFLGFLVDLSGYVEHREESVDDLIESFKLQKAAKRRIGDLSLGWRQRVAMAAAFVGDPDIVILDEPTSGLDPVAVEDFTTILLEKKNLGKTILFSSHQLSEVEKVADRVGIISEGVMIRSGSVEELLSDSGAESLNELFLESVEDVS